MAKPVQKSNKAVPAGEDPFIDELSADVDFDALDEDDREPASEDEEEEEEEEDEEELEEVETPPAPVRKAKPVAVAPPAKPVAKVVVKTAKPEPKPVKPVKPVKKAEADAEEASRSRLADTTRVALTDVGRSLNGKGAHDAIAGILRARKSGSATVSELIAKLMATFVPRTAPASEKYFRAYIGAAVRRGFVTIVE